MAYDLEEQEQIDTLKAWWKQHGNAVIMGLTVFLLAIAGSQAWRYYQNKTSSQAALLYESLQAADSDGDNKKVREIAGLMLDNYGRTTYAPRAALVAAKSNYQAGDVQSTKAQLQWALDHAKTDEIKDAARLRLAGVLLDEKDHDGALKLLDAKHGAGFDGLYADLKGDVLVASGKHDDARASYRIALEKMDPSGAYRNVVQMKLDSLGG